MLRNYRKYNYQKNNLKCYFCNGNHKCRNCSVEKKVAPILKKIIGQFMESYIGNYYNCPRCNKKSLFVLGNHEPSLDIKCQNCI